MISSDESCIQNYPIYPAVFVLLFSVFVLLLLFFSSTIKAELNDAFERCSYRKYFLFFFYFYFV